MQKSFIYIDTITKSQITSTGTFVTKSSDYLELERGQWQILCIQFVQREEDELGVVTLTPAVLPMSDTYLFVADSDFEDDNSLMLKSFQSTIPFDENDPESNRFNIEGDWIDGSTADLSKGQMSIRINSDTEKFATVMGNRKSVTSGLYINIKQYIAGLSNPSNIAWFAFTAVNTVRDWGEPEELPPQGTVIIPFISSYLKNPFEFQFSEDGVDWHDTQADNDVYYRQRIKGINAAWGATIEMLKGERGDSFKVDAVGTLEDRALYDEEPAGFSYLATDTELVYFRVGVVSANWSEGVPLGLKGDTGDSGATRYPVTACFGNETYQIVCYLDAAHGMTFAGYIAEPVNKIDLYIVSANPEYTGNIVLNVGAESFTVPVGAIVGKVTLNLSTPATGIVSIVRDTANAGDTLSDGTDAITAYVVDWSVQ